MSDSALRAAESARASVRLGLILRTVLVAPGTGFESALKAARRRERTGARGSEGVAPYVLAGLGGAAGMVLWLKLSGMAELRSVPRSAYTNALLVISLLAGAVVALLAQALWGLVGVRVTRALGGGARSRDLRITWGAAVFPQAFVLLTLVPLDLLIVGPGAFATEPLGDSLSTAWAALSAALQVSFGIWSLVLFVKGVQVAGDLRLWRALVATLCAGCCLAVVASVVVLGAARLAGIV